MNIYQMTDIAETLLGYIEQMRELDKKIAEYCPQDCSECPLKRKCIEDGHLDFGYDFTIENFVDWINYGEEKEEERSDAKKKKYWDELCDSLGCDPEWIKYKDEL